MMGVDVGVAFDEGETGRVVAVVTAGSVVAVAGTVGVGAGTGAVVVDDELDDVTVVLGDELRALGVAGATGGDEADPPHAASTTGSAMIQRTLSLMLGHYPWQAPPLEVGAGVLSTISKDLGQGRPRTLPAPGGAASMPAATEHARRSRRLEGVRPDDPVTTDVVQ